MKQFIDPLAGLNDAQREAASCTEGAVLVLAGAGSGKTRVLAHRVANVVHQKHARPWQILAVTFTNKSARELKERVAAITPDGDEVAAGTFHSIFLRMLRREAKAIDYPRDFTVFDMDDSNRLVKMILNEKGEKRFQPRSIRAAISRMKNDMITPEQHENRAKTSDQKFINEVYREYENRLLQYAGMDFDDLLIRPIGLLKNHPSVLAYWRDRWRYIHVDEYQDTNLAQFELIKILGGSRPNLCVVGDDDQSIYGWRGARVENIFRFREAFEGTKVFRLEQNYRSTQPILELAHSVVSRSTMREDKKLWTEKKEGKKPEVIRLSTEADEAGEVVDRIGREVLSGKREYRDYAILYRTNAQSRLFEDALRSRRFPYQVIGSLRFYDRKEIRDALAYFKICINPRDDVSLRRIISEPPRGIGTTTLDHLVEWSRANDTTLTKALINGEVVEGLSSRGANNCRKFGEQIENWRNELKEKKLNEWAKWVLEDSGYIRRLEDGDKFENATRLDNINELISGLAQFEEEADESENGLADFVEQVALATDIDKYDPEADSVRMMTIHSAKGLEFPVVFVTGLEKGLFPFERMGDSDYDPDEERRLFYVAVTRAEKELILTMAWQRRKWGVLSGCAPSPFLKELPREFISESGTSSPYAAKQGSLGFGSSRDRNSKKAVSSFRKTNTSSSQKQETISPDDIPAIHYGDLVRHKVFGDGMVVNAVKYRNDIKVTVEFEDGQHDLLQSKAKLQPLKDF